MAKKRFSDFRSDLVKLRDLLKKGHNIDLVFERLVEAYPELSDGSVLPDLVKKEEVSDSKKGRKNMEEEYRISSEGNPAADKWLIHCWRKVENIQQKPSSAKLPAEKSAFVEEDYRISSDRRKSSRGQVVDSLLEKS